MNVTWWDVVLHHWPMTIFVPAILILLFALTVVTRIMDGRDRGRPLRGEPPVAAGARTNGGETTVAGVG